VLARCPRARLEPDGEPEPVPESLLPAVVAEVRRTRRALRALRAVTLAAAAAVLLIGGTVAVVTMSDDDAPTTSPPPSEITTAPAERMDSLGPGAVTGWISLTEVPWGTRIDLTCTYGTAGGYGGYGGGGGTSYAMFVRTAGGRVEQVGTWHAEPGRETKVSTATAATPDEIVAVEVRTAAGVSVLRLAQ
jgi:hypothetical protein